MYEVYDAKTGELVLVDLFELEHGLANGSLVSSLEQKEPAKRTRNKVADNEPNKA